MVVIQAILIHQSLQMYNNSVGPFDPTPYRVTPEAGRINVFWFASLSLVLMAAFAAMIVRGWVRELARGLKILELPEDRSAERQRRQEGLVRWRLSWIVAFVPILVYASLLLFFLGLLDLLYHTHLPSAIATLVVVFIGFAFYAITTAISIFDSSAPFRSIITRNVRIGLLTIHKHSTNRRKAFSTSIKRRFQDRLNQLSAIFLCCSSFYQKRSLLRPSADSAVRIRALNWLADKTSISRHNLAVTRALLLQFSDHSLRAGNGHWVFRLKLLYGDKAQCIETKQEARCIAAILASEAFSPSFPWALRRGYYKRLADLVVPRLTTSTLPWDRILSSLVHSRYPSGATFFSSGFPLTHWRLMVEAIMELPVDEEGYYRMFFLIDSLSVTLFTFVKFRPPQPSHIRVLTAILSRFCVGRFASLTNYDKTDLVHFDLAERLTGAVLVAAELNAGGDGDEHFTQYFASLSNSLFTCSISHLRESRTAYSLDSLRTSLVDMSGASPEVMNPLRELSLWYLRFLHLRPGPSPTCAKVFAGLDQLRNWAPLLFTHLPADLPDPESRKILELGALIATKGERNYITPSQNFLAIILAYDHQTSQSPAEMDVHTLVFFTRFIRTTNSAVLCALLLDIDYQNCWLSLHIHNTYRMWFPEELQKRVSVSWRDQPAFHHIAEQRLALHESGILPPGEMVLIALLGSGSFNITGRSLPFLFSLLRDDSDIDQIVLSRALERAIKTILNPSLSEKDLLKSWSLFTLYVHANWKHLPRKWRHQVAATFFARTDGNSPMEEPNGLVWMNRVCELLSQKAMFKTLYSQILTVMSADVKQALKVSTSGPRLLVSDEERNSMESYEYTDYILAMLSGPAHCMLTSLANLLETWEEELLVDDQIYLQKSSMIQCIAPFLQDPDARRRIMRVVELPRPYSTPPVKGHIRWHE
jgi:Family of unknown function (DUF6535)